VSDTTPPRSNTWLVVSICLNVVLIAMIAVGVARAWHRQHEMELGRAFSTQSIIAHLPADRAKKVKAVVDAHAYRLGVLADDATKSRLEARPIFTAPVFDPVAYAKAQERMRKADDALQTERMKQLMEIAALLTPAERQEIGERARNQPALPSSRR